MPCIGRGRYCADLAAGVAEDLQELEVYLLRTDDGAPAGLVHLEPGEKTPFVSHFTVQKDQFTKTGSGQTQQM